MKTLDPQVKKVSDFEVFQVMSDQNLDIGLHVELLNFNRDKRGGKVTVGVANPHFDYLINGAGTGVTTHYGLFYVVNKKQFEEIKKELQSKV